MTKIVSATLLQPGYDTLAGVIAGIVEVVDPQPARKPRRAIDNSYFVGTSEDSEVIPASLIFEEEDDEDEVEIGDELDESIDTLAEQDVQDQNATTSEGANMAYSRNVRVLKEFLATKSGRNLAGTTGAVFAEIRQAIKYRGSSGKAADDWLASFLRSAARDGEIILEVDGSNWVVRLEAEKPKLASAPPAAAKSPELLREGASQTQEIEVAQQIYAKRPPAQAGSSIAAYLVAALLEHLLAQPEGRLTAPSAECLRPVLSNVSGGYVNVIVNAAHDNGLVCRKMVNQKKTDYIEILEAGVGWLAAYEVASRVGEAEGSSTASPATPAAPVQPESSAAAVAAEPAVAPVSPEPNTASPEVQAPGSTAERLAHLSKQLQQAAEAILDDINQGTDNEVLKAELEHERELRTSAEALVAELRAEVARHSDNAAAAMRQAELTQRQLDESQRENADLTTALEPLEQQVHELQALIAEQRARKPATPLSIVSGDRTS